MSDYVNALGELAKGNKQGAIDAETIEANPAIDPISMLAGGYVGGKVPVSLYDYFLTKPTEAGGRQLAQQWLQQMMKAWNYKPVSVQNYMGIPW